MALTTEQIHAAADKIDAQGLRPTLAAVRQLLGTGSFSTIQMAMKSWESKANGEGNEAEEMPETPDAVSAAAERFTAEIWRIAERLAGERYQAERAEAQQAVEAARLEAAQAAETADELAAQLDAEKREREQAQNEVKRIEQLLKNAEISLAQAQAAADTYKTLADERVYSIQALEKALKKPSTPAKKSAS